MFCCMHRIFIYVLYPYMFLDISFVLCSFCCAGVSSRIFMGILWLFLLCAFFSIGVLAYQRIPWSSLRSRSTSLLWPMAPADSVGVFSDHMRALEQHFQSQRNELWRRSHIHLQRHLQTAEHTEPVTVILAAGRRAEGTLRCLAVRLASAFSSAVNGSVLEMDGATMADKDSNQVREYRQDCVWQ